MVCVGKDLPFFASSGVFKTPIRLVSCQNTYGNVNYPICAQSVRVKCLCVCVCVSTLSCFPRYAVGEDAAVLEHL